MTMTKWNLSAALLLLTQHTTTAKNDNPFEKIGSFKEALTMGSQSGSSPSRVLASENERPNFFNQMHRSFLTATGRKAASEEDCDVAFFSCLDNDGCTKCFTQIENADVDWTSVSPTTPCADVVDILVKKGSCGHLKHKQEDYDSFCNTFDSCMSVDLPGPTSDDDVAVDCDSLTSCDWPGMHPGFIGDGACQSIGCYNHKICNYDGGDCCADSCVSKLSECGSDGYVCIDPKSKNCDPFFTESCENPDPEKEKEKKEIDEQTNPTISHCGPDETPYRLFKYDSWGDGWDMTEMTISLDKKEIYKGTLERGFEGSEYICLSSEAACYTVDLKGGTWGNEVSWEIRPARSGTRSVAQGGSPQNCHFPVAGDNCKNTCDKFPSPDERVKDPEYKTYKQAFHCAQKKCYLQLETCKKDTLCHSCLGDNPPGDCYSSDEFNAVVECTMCNCMQDDAIKEFCEKKDRDQIDTGNKNKEDENKKGSRSAPQCNADQIRKGSQAALQFSSCSNLDQISSTVTAFDNENFGALDLFENCAHTFQNEPMHGGKKALDCMNILNTAINDPLSGTTTKKDPPKEAIAALASNIYTNAEAFCDCATSSSAIAPMCSSFLNFKTLLYESLDACQALDEIDCDAFNEFQGPCKNNLITQFNKVDFENSKQCEFVQNTCGGVGAFPAFRRLDCDKELPKQSWDFYQDYAKKCLKKSNDNGGHHSVPVPAPTPKHHPRPTYHAPTTPYVPKPDKPDEKPVDPEPYVPEEERHRHGFLWFMFIMACFGGAGYWYRKKKMDSFDFTRYRRVRARNYGQDGELFEGLSSNNAASSFEPPSLPPPPSAMGDKEMA